MTVPAQSTKIVYNATGAATPYAVPFTFIAAADLALTAVSATGVRATLELGVHYTVTGGNRLTGAVVPTGSGVLLLPVGATLEIERATPRTQPTDYTTHDTFPAETHELALDRQMLIVQEQDQQRANLESRAVRTVVGEAAPVLPSLASRVASGFGVFGHVAAGALALLSAGQVAAAVAPQLPAMLKGDPGGNVAATGTLLALKTMSIPAGTKAIRTTHHSVRYGKGGAWYREKDAAEAAPPAWAEDIAWVEDADARIWILNEEIPDAWMFGLVGDGAYDYATDTVTGTDDSAILNHMRRWCLHYGKRVARIPGDALTRVENPVLAGLGETFTSFVFWGLEAGYSATSILLRGAALITSRNDIPVCVVQGGRNSGFVGVHVQGPAYKHILTNDLGRSVGTGPVIDDRDRAAWLPAGSQHKNGRYDAGCAFAADPYSGVRPGTSYPDCPYNTAAGESGTQWGRSPTSEPIFRFCSAEGFSVGIGLQIADFDGNADFARCTGFRSTYSIVTFAMGNSQARNADTSNLVYARVHTVLDGNAYGRQIGNCQGLHDNWSGGGQICLIDYKPGFSGSVCISNGYLEGGHRLAIVRGTDGGELEFRNCNYVIYLDAGTEAKRGVPVALIDSDGLGGTTKVRIKISGQIAVNEYLPIHSLNAETDVYILARKRGQGVAIRPSEAIAHNGTAGGILVPMLGGVSRESYTIRTIYSPIERDEEGKATALTGTAPFDGVTAEAPNRTLTAPIFATRARPSAGNAAVDLPPHRSVLAPGTSLTLTGRTLKMTYAGFAAVGHVMRFAMHPGAIWRHSSNHWLEVTDYDTATNVITLHVKNGYIDTAGTITWQSGSAPNFAAGSFNTYGTARFVPSNPLFGDFSSSSHIITNVGIAGGTGAATALATDFAAGAYGTGDYLYADPDVVGTMWPPTAPIAARDATARTITGISGQNPARTIAGLRLIGLRAPVAGTPSP